LKRRGDRARSGLFVLEDAERTVGCIEALNVNWPAAQNVPDTPPSVVHREKRTVAVELVCA
jgi:hypothetical protein